MTPPATETFTNTLVAVCNQLNTDEATILGLCQRYGIQPHRDAASGSLYFGRQQVEVLQRGLESQASQLQAEPQREQNFQEAPNQGLTQQIASQVSATSYQSQANQPAVQPSSVASYRSSSPVSTGATSSSVSSSRQASQPAALSRGDLSRIVDAVSNAKEGILKDLSQLLDDKLSGLDDVVVELIRSKSENDALREEVKRLEESRQQMQSELGKFRPAAFGFYRKDN